MKVKLWSNPKYTVDNKTLPIEWEFKPGITMLIGPNGSGKTMTLNQIDDIFNSSNEKAIKDINYKLIDKYICYRYSSLEQTRFAKDMWIENNKMKDLALSIDESEGQFIWHVLNDIIGDIGRTVTKAQKENKQGVIILFDEIDSGLSLDIIYKFKDLLKFMIKDNNNEIEMYIICTSNSYEMCKDFKCLDVRSLLEQEFRNYDEYERYFLRGDENNEV